MIRITAILFFFFSLVLLAGCNVSTDTMAPETPGDVPAVENTMDEGVSETATEDAADAEIEAIVDEETSIEAELDELEAEEF